MKKNIMVPISIYYALIFMGGASFFSYIGLYYADIHLRNMEIGLLTTCSAVVALLGQPFWGIVSDRSKSKNRILMLILCLTAASMWLIPQSGPRLWLLLGATALFGFFQCAVNPLSDAITLELASKGTIRFSRVRTYGSLGFAIMSAIAGWIFDKNITYIFSVFFCLMVISLCCSTFIPNVEGHPSSKRKVSLIEIFQNKKLTYIYIYSFIIQATLGYFFAFNAIYSKQQGISTEWIGIAVMVGSFSQFPFMIFFDKLYRRFGITKILLFSGLIHGIRWLLYATCLTPVTIVFLWLLHGGTFMLFYLCLAEYVNQHVAKELKVSGQMMNSIISSGLSRIVGGFLGGYCSDQIGIQHTFLLISAISFVTVIAFYFTITLSKVFNDKIETANTTAL